MPQNKVEKLISCTCWWQKRNLTPFYRMGLFQSNTANVAIKKELLNDDAFFEGALCKDCTLTLCTILYKHLKKCGSCSNRPIQTTV